MIKQYAACVAEKLKAYEELNITEPAIYLDVWRSMNRRFQQRMIDPNVDMVKAPWSPWQQTPWIKPLLTELSPWREKFTQIKKELREKSNFSDITFVADFPGLHLENFVSEALNASLTLLHGKLINITAINAMITLPANYRITHDLLPTGLVAQSVEQRTIKSGGRVFDSCRGRRLFSSPFAISHFLTRANAHWEIPGFTLVLQHTLQSEFSDP